MKKVGIITLHRVINHGSMLQAYATQEIVRTQGYKPEIINYVYPNPLHRQDTSWKGRILNNANRIAKKLLGVGDHEKKFEGFLQKHLDLSRNYPTRESILNDPPQYDIYLSGSDQLWHPRSARNDPSFFLDFAGKARRVAFASSFGVDELSAEDESRYSPYLREYNAIAVREKSAIKLVEKMTGKAPAWVLDPTLLLTDEDWSAIAEPFKTERPYILIYGNMNNAGPYMEAMAKEIQKKTGWDIVRIHGKAYHALCRDMKYILDAGPLEYLGLFKNAAFVLANSFHGTAYAINFGRPFYSICASNPDLATRQRSLLQLLQLEERGITQGETFPANWSLDVNFKQAHALLEVERTASISWLKNALDGEQP